MFNIGARKRKTLVKDMFKFAAGQSQEGTACFRTVSARVRRRP